MLLSRPDRMPRPVRAGAACTSRRQGAPHGLCLALVALLLHDIAESEAAPAPSTCDDWARKGECTANPSFMWAECAAACKSAGLREPWAEVDERSLAAPSSSSQVLELSFAASHGLAPVRIVLRNDLAPKTVAAIVAAIGSATSGSAGGVAFYRNEAVPTSPPEMCGPILCGPYALIQGRLRGLAGTPAEAMPLVRQGFVARIGQSEDFFIALADHLEWGHSFTVWGTLERGDSSGLATLEAIAQLPHHEQKAAGAETIMRLLDVELPATAAVHAAGSGVDATLETRLAGGAPGAHDDSPAEDAYAAAAATWTTEL